MAPSADVKSAGGVFYQATYRRAEVALPCLVAMLVLFGGGLALLLQLPVTWLETMILGLAALVVGSAVLLLLTVFRVHRWTLEPDGLRIRERPKVPLMGWGRRRFLRFDEILALRRVESGVDRRIELVAADGRCYRLPQAMAADRSAIAEPASHIDLDVFAGALRDAAGRAGHVLPPTTEALSAWNTILGLAFLLLLLLIAMAFAGGVGWALLDGMSVSTQNRGAYAAAIALLLPVGAAWLLLKSWRRRRFVLATLRRPR